MSALRLVFLPSDANAAVQTLLIGASGNIVADGVLGTSDASDMVTILVVPGTDVLARWIELPGANMAQANAAARLLLGDMVASPIGGLHVAVASEDDSGRRLVCIAGRARMQSFLEQAAALGVTPDHMVPDHLLLPVPSGGSILVAEWGNRCLLRGAQLSASIETDLLSLVTGDRPILRLAANELGQAFSTGSARIPVDLLQHEFATRSESSPASAWRRAAVLAAALLLSPLLLWGAEAARGAWKANIIEARTEALAQKLAPGDADPVASITSRMEALSANRNLFHASAALFAGLDALDGAKLERIAWLADQNVLSASVRHGSAEDIAALAGTLRDAGLVLTEDGSVPSEGGFSTSIAVRAAP